MVTLTPAQHSDDCAISVEYRATQNNRLLVASRAALSPAILDRLHVTQRGLPSEDSRFVGLVLHSNAEAYLAYATSDYAVIRDLFQRESCRNG